MPVKKFLSHDTYFAFANKGATPFRLTNKLQNNAVVPLGPLYLVWDNIYFLPILIHVSWRRYFYRLHRL